MRAPIEQALFTVLEMGTTLTNTKGGDGQSSDHQGRSAHCAAFRLGRQRGGGGGGGGQNGIQPAAACALLFKVAKYPFSCPSYQIWHH